MMDLFTNLCWDADEHDSSKICYKCKKAGHLSKDCQEYMYQAKQANGNVSGDPLSAEPDKANIEMDVAATEEDGIHDIGEEEREKLNDLDYLTGNPLPGDILLYAVPVCGPYSALQTYKYRVKITPGTAKKGKGILLVLFSNNNKLGYIYIYDVVSIILLFHETTCLTYISLFTTFSGMKWSRS